MTTNWKIPGDGNEIGTPPGEWVACGAADGVIFLGDILGPTEHGKIRILFVGYERQALRYLRPPLSHPQAAAWIAAHPGERGFCAPDISFLLNRHREIFAEAEATQRPIERIFIATIAGINANQPEHRWIVEKVEDGIWAVLYSV